MARTSTDGWPRLWKLLRVLVAGGAALSGTCATAPKSSIEPDKADKKEASRTTSKPPTQKPEPGGGVQGW